MNTFFRVFVLVIICIAVTGALRKKFSPQIGEHFVEQQPIVSAQEQEVDPSWAQEVDEQQLLPQKQERASYLIWSDDPEIIYKKYLLASYLYKKHGSVEALPLAISYASQLGRFEDASLLLKELPDINTLKETLEVPVLMKLLMNTSDLSFWQLKQLKDLIETLKTQWSIDDAEYNMYYFVITLIKWDMDNAQFYLNGLQAGRFYREYSQLRALETTTKQYGETPAYYLRGVRAMYLYQQGRWWPARTIWQQIRQQDPAYLLAEQLFAYSSIALQDRKWALLSLQQLQKIDPEYRDVYQFFQAISHYSLKEYEASILLFKQIPETSVYTTDVVRYMLLAYVALQDYEQIGVLLDKLITVPLLQDADVYTLFDSLLYSDQKEQWYTLFTRFGEQIERLEKRCQLELKDKAYICLYGKAGILLASGEEAKAYQILRRIVSWYPRVSLYKMLWDIAQEQSTSEEAEERYRRAFLIQQENTQYATPGTKQIGLQ